jgi:hypothetical protein
VRPVPTGPVQKKTNLNLKMQKKSENTSRFIESNGIELFQI